MKNSEDSKKEISIINLFKNSQLLKLALTHRSWVNEHKGLRSSNERLEFLGDAVLEFVVSKELFLNFPSQEEGYLTSLRANLVNTTNLSDVAQKLDLGADIYLSKGEEEGGGRNNPSLLADTIEAIIGALFIDSGIDSASKFIHDHILDSLAEKASKPLKDPKSLLQETVQAKGIPSPKYVVVSEVGPDHAKTFIVDAVVDAKAIGRGSGKSKSEAEQKAAEKALETIK